MEVIIFWVIYQVDWKKAEEVTFNVFDIITGKINQIYW